ncbi:MAG TPA: glycosyltransferase family 39 protein [Casimicrobiaceae bacterium]|nr:glycosyltransferase family 39 protein [Casimicrobiaceae bacterium]
MPIGLHASAASPERATVEPGNRLAEILNIAVLAGAALVTLYVRVRLLSVPLERDEGEYAYLAQLMLQGRPPFLDVYTLKLPGTPLAYAAFMSIFGQTKEAIHLALLVVNALTACLLWLLARRLFDSQAASASTAIFLLLTSSEGVLGVFAHATQFVNLFAVAGFLLILRYEEGGRKAIAFAAGICFGAAILMKQHAAVLALFAFCLVARITRARPNRCLPTISTSALFATGVAIPLASISLWTIEAGTFGKLWFWTFDYALEYVRGLPLPVGLSQLDWQFTRVASHELPVWILAALGVAVSLIGGHRERTTSRVLVIGFLLSSFIAMCPGLYFREHYFVLILPSVAMLSGLAMTKGVALATGKWPIGWVGLIPVAVLVGVLCAGYWSERAYLFRRTPTEVSRDLYLPSPFAESQEIARYINANSSADDRIAVLGSEPQLFFYANRRSATGYIYMYGLMEDQPYAASMQREMIAEIETARPLYLVFVNVQFSWMFNDKSLTRIFHWVDDYVAASYRLSGVVDIGWDHSRYVWGESAESYTPLSKNFVTVWRRVP